MFFSLPFLPLMWPALLGDLTNAYLGFALALNLFANFLAQQHPSDLIINAMSLNYLTMIDNEIMSDLMRSSIRHVWGFGEAGCLEGGWGVRNEIFLSTE